MNNEQEPRRDGIAKLAKYLAVDGQRAPGAEVRQAVEAFGQQVGVLSVRLARAQCPAARPVMDTAMAVFDLVALWRDMDAIWDRELARMTSQEEDQDA